MVGRRQRDRPAKDTVPEESAEGEEEEESDGEDEGRADSEVREESQRGS